MQQLMAAAIKQERSATEKEKERAFVLALGCANEKRLVSRYGHLLFASDEMEPDETCTSAHRKGAAQVVESRAAPARN